MSEMISIITPMYNSEKFILDMIKSVQVQTYQNWEMIVVDDCSQDGGPNIVKKISKTDDRIKLISQKKNSGPSHVRNIAIGLAKGRYLAFLDSDDLWHEEKLNKKLKFMKKNHYAFTYTGFEKINEAGEVIGTGFPYKKEVCYYDLLKSNHIGCLTAMLDLQLIGEKLYMPNIKGGREDHGFWLDILKRIEKAYCLKEVLGQYRIRAKSMTINKTANVKYQWELYRKIEKLNMMKSLYYMTFYAFYGMRKYSN